MTRKFKSSSNLDGVLASASFFCVLQVCLAGVCLVHVGEYTGSNFCVLHVYTVPKIRTISEYGLNGRSDPGRLVLG